MESVIYHDRDGKKYEAKIIREYEISIQQGEGSSARKIKRQVADLIVDFVGKGEKTNSCTIQGAGEKDKLFSIPGKAYFIRKEKSKKE
jgi:uncharacterized protein YhfF